MKEIKILTIGINFILQGQKLKETAQLLLDENKNLLVEAEKKVREGEQLLEKALDQQTLTSELLSDVDGAHAKAEEAVKRGEQTLKEAQETLQKLSGKI